MCVYHPFASSMFRLGKLSEFYPFGKAQTIIHISKLSLEFTMKFESIPKKRNKQLNQTQPCL